MNINITLQDLWGALTLPEIEDGCLALIEGVGPGGSKTRDNILNSLARSYRFRPIFITNRSNKENLPLLVNRISSREFAVFHDDLIRAWLIKHHLPMLDAFLAKCGIPHRSGFVDGEPPTPTQNQFEIGITGLIHDFNARDVGIYLGYLILFGDKFWISLRSAVISKKLDLIQLLRNNTHLDKIESNRQPTSTPAPLEDSDEFTTLDNWLIRTAVAAAFGESGALTEDQVEDLVEEITSLNAQRHHTLFHLGFLHALFDKTLTLHFRGENEERRLWYFAGVVFGLLRSNKAKQVLELLNSNSDLTRQLCENTRSRCGSMLLPRIHPILWEAKEFGMLLRWVKGQLVRLDQRRCVDLLFSLHADAATLVRRGHWVEAEGFLDLLERFVKNSKSLPTNFIHSFLSMNARKRAQVFQLKGDFQEAEQLLEPLSKMPDLEDAGNILCDRALIAAGFKSLTAIIPGKEESSSGAIGTALSKHKNLLENAVRSYPSSSTNAHFCLGFIALAVERDASSAAVHFRSTLAGMLKKEEAYSDGGLIQWTRFFLGLSLLENADTADLQHAREYVQRSIETPIVFPLWLWSRIMQASVLFDDKTLGVQIAEHLLRNRGAAAYDSIWQSGLGATVSPLRQQYLKWMDDAVLPVLTKWRNLEKMLPCALRDSDIQQAQSILDSMEGLAVQGGQYRFDFLILLDNDSNYSPAWDLEDAIHAKIKLFELEGNFSEASALLRKRFFALRSSGDFARNREAKSVLERLRDLNADTSDIDQLAIQFLLEPNANNIEKCPLRDGAPVSVLYLGGNETQAAYEHEIRSELTREYPGLKIEFYYPGWDSNWNTHLDKVRQKIFYADVVVLNKLVRTQFGRNVRAICTSEKPWFACTGRGKQSLKRSIESAGLWVARREPKNS